MSFYSHVYKKGKITNSDYQSLNGISKRTATTELTELADKFKVLTKTGTSGFSNSKRAKNRALFENLTVYRHKECRTLSVNYLLTAVPVYSCASSPPVPIVGESQAPKA